MYTLFTTCKPFEGLDGIHQRNAIRSWTALSPRPEILIVGNDPGTAEVCAEFDLRHLPDVVYTSHGKPDVADVFKRASAAASYDLLAHVNADIVLGNDFGAALTTLRWRLGQFMMIGQRHNLDVDYNITDFAAIRALAQMKADLLAPTGTDYFGFTRGMLDGMTAGLGVGHLAWDNYIPWYAVTRDHAALVDATGAVLAVHQNHDAPNYNGHPGAGQNHHIVRHQEAPEVYCGLFLKDAAWVLTPGLTPDRDLCPKVSIVLPSYKRPERLEKAVRGILGVTDYTPLEVIVVIDEDTDSRDRVLALGDPRVRVLFNDQRQGVIACFNQGLAASRGHILAFWNDDCMPERGWLEAALRAHQEQLAGYGLVGFNDGYQDGNVLSVQYLFDRPFCIDHLGGVMAYPVYEFAWNDTECNARAKNANRFYWCRESVVQHHHWSRDGGPMDDLNRVNMEKQGRDGYIYYAREKEGFPNNFEPAIRW